MEQNMVVCRKSMDGKLDCVEICAGCWEVAAKTQRQWLVGEKWSKKYAEGKEADRAT